MRKCLSFILLSALAFHAAGNGIISVHPDSHVVSVTLTYFSFSYNKSVTAVCSNDTELTGCVWTSADLNVTGMEFEDGYGIGTAVLTDHGPQVSEITNTYSATSFTHKAQYMDSLVDLYVYSRPVTNSITYFLNDGSISGPYAETYTVESGDIDLPSPTKGHYDFSGWYTNANFEGSAVASIPSGSTGNKTFYAKWTPVDYVITVQASPSAGGGVTGGGTYPYGSSATLTATNNPGYVFTQWSDGSSSSTRSVNVLDTTTYTAYFTKVEYEVTLDNLGADVSGTRTVKVEYNGDMPALSTCPEKLGYDFGGYYAQPGGTGTQYYKNDGTPRGNTWDTAGDGTIYAYWIPHSYTLSFDAGEGTGTMDDMVLDYGVETNLPPVTFEKAGHVFTGWATNLATEAVFADKAAVSNLTSDANGSFTLTAKWTLGHYYIAFDANGGEGTMDVQEFSYDEGAELSTNAFVREGFAFAGWAWDANATTNNMDYLDCQTVTNIISEMGRTNTLYAVWKAGLAVAVNADGTKLAYTTGGYNRTSLEEMNIKWSPVDKDGAYVGQSGELPEVNSSYTYMRTTLPGPGVLTFKWRINAPVGWYDGYDPYDDQQDVSTLPRVGNWLTFSAVGDESETNIAEIASGIASTKEWADSGWVSVVYTNVADSLTVEWKFSYDLHDDVIGGGTAWVDDVAWVSDPSALKTVTFDANGGTPATTTVKVAEGAKVGALPNVEFPGHTFEGWFTESDGGDPVTADTIITNEVTFYAHWSLLPGTIDAIVSSYDGVYDGAGHGIAVEVTEPDGALVKYALAEDGPYLESPVLFTNAMADAVTVWCVVECDGYASVTNSGTVKISPKTLTDEMVTVSDEGCTYDGEAKEPEVSVVDGDPSIISEDDFDVEYSGNVESGTDTALVTVTGKGNYTGSVEKPFSIAKATYDMGAAAWDYAGAFQYDGTVKMVLVTGLPDGVEVSGYDGNSASAPGTYTAHVTFSYDTVNHNAPVVEDLEWVIQANAMSKLSETFAGSGEVTQDGDGGWKVTLTNDVTGPVEIADNLGNVSIDLNGHSITGTGGSPAIRIVAGDGDGAVTRLSIGDSSDGEKGTVSGDGESVGIEIAEGAASGVKIDVQDGVKVLNGDGTEQTWLETLTVGEYFKKTLTELGYDVPTDGTPYSVVAKGLPAGLKLKYNAAVKNKKGKIVTKAKTTWWIEGVPTAVLDYGTNPAYLVITANGATVTEPLPVKVLAQAVEDLGELALGTSVNTNGWLEGVGKGWSVSGLPTGLKFATKKVTKKSGKKTVTVAEPYAVYGKTTKAGLFTITAKKKVGVYYETKKYRVLVPPKAVDASIFSDSLTNITTMAYVPFEWDLTNDVSSVGGKVAKVTGLPAGLAFAAANTYRDKKKTKLKQAGQTIVGKPTKPGTYAVTFTKNVKSGKKTVAKTAQILWKVVANDAELSLGFNTAGGVIESGVVGLKYGDFMAFTATGDATVTASGLPKGITLANLGGGNYAFKGFTTKAGTYLVTVKATLNGKTVTQRVALKVDALPAWAKGTYNGVVTGTGLTNGLATVTVSAAGKISGKFQERGTNWTISAASYTGYDAVASNYSATVAAKYTYKVKSGKKTVKKSLTREFTLSVEPGAFGGVAALAATGGSPSLATEIEAWQNLWGSTYKAVGKKLFYTSKKKQYKTFARTVEVDGKECALSLKVTTAGAVTATLTFDTGKTKKDSKTKKQVKVYYKPTCSTAVIPTSAADAVPFTGCIYLYFAPSAANGFTGYVGTAGLEL